MTEVLPNEADQNFLYQLICSQLENDGYLKSAKCLQVELNSLEISAPGDKLEQLVNMCIQIKKHIDLHFNKTFDKGKDKDTSPANHENGGSRDCGESGSTHYMSPEDGMNNSDELDVDSPMKDVGVVETADVTNKVLNRVPPFPRTAEFIPELNQSPLTLNHHPLHIDAVQSPRVDLNSPRVNSHSPMTYSISPLTSSASLAPAGSSGGSPTDAKMSPLTAPLVPDAQINIDSCRRRLLQHQLVLQQIQLQQIHNSTIDEQAKKISEYMLKCYKTDLSMASTTSTAQNSMLSSIRGIPSSSISDIKPSLIREPSAITTTFNKNPLPIAGMPGSQSPADLLPHTQSIISSTQSLLAPVPALLPPTQTPVKSENFSPSFEGTSKIHGTKVEKTAAESQAEFDRKRFPCRYCGRRFTQQSALQVHERTHTGEKPYHCHYCEKAFTQISNLKCHERLHTGEKPYMCQLCGKRFTQSASLRCHMRSHTGERPYLCKYCNKRFTQPASLQHHIRIHTGEKPYKCEHCAKCFTQPSSLVVHRRLHTGERPFVCQICGKSYTQAMPLKEHMRTHHQPEKTSPLSFSLGKPFSLQMNQLQSSLTANIGSLPFILSNKFMPDLRSSVPAQDVSPSSVSQILFNRQSTAFQSVYPSLNKDVTKEQSIE